MIIVATPSLQKWLFTGRRELQNFNAVEPLLVEQTV